MARKNNTRSEQSGSLHFDSRTRTVMAGQDSHDNIKEKVQAVREVVLGKSNNEIVMVLQYYDYNVEKAIQAYLEDNAKAALGEWHMPAAKPNKKKKNKKKPSNQAPAENGVSPPGNGATVSIAPSFSQPLPAQKTTEPIEETPISSTKTGLQNGDLHNGLMSQHRLEDTDHCLPKALSVAESIPDRVSSKKDSENSAQALSSTTASASSSKAQPHVRSHAHSGSHGHSQSQHHGHMQRARTASERSTASSVGAGGDNHSKRPFHGLERAIKDLQRQTTSLERLHLMLDHEVDRSYKSIKTVFEEMRTHLNTREKEMVAEMDVVKQQAYDIFKMRQEKAAMLKVQIERAEKISEAELADLRADVKHFVTDRKVDEEIGRTTRFHYDSDHLKNEIMKFGEVLHVKSIYSMRRPSVSSVASSGAGNEEVSSLPSPSVHIDDSTVQDAKRMINDEIVELQSRLKNSLSIQSTGGTKQADAGNDSRASESVKDGEARRNNNRNRNRNEREPDRNNERTPSPRVPPNIGAGSSSTPQNASAPPTQSTASAAFSNNPVPPRPQRSSPTRGGGTRGRGRGGPRGGQGSGRGSPRRPFSGSGSSMSRGGGGGGEQFFGKQARVFTAPSNRPMVVNGSSS